MWCCRVSQCTALVRFVLRSYVSRLLVFVCHQSVAISRPGLAQFLGLIMILLQEIVIINTLIVWGVCHFAFSRSKWKTLVRQWPHISLNCANYMKTRLMFIKHCVRHLLLYSMLVNLTYPGLGIGKLRTFVSGQWTHTCVAQLCTVQGWDFYLPLIRPRSVNCRLLFKTRSQWNACRCLTSMALSSVVCHYLCTY